MEALILELCGECGEFSLTAGVCLHPGVAVSLFSTQKENVFLV